MTMPILPPLGLLPAFVAAGRHGSFKAAAHELHLTPSAVSQQIKALEDALGLRLFERSRRTVSLTEVGREYLRDVQLALSELSSATRQVQQRANQHNIIRISTTAFVAAEFLLPRLSHFRARFPNVDLRTESTMQLVDLAHDPCDAAVRVGGAISPPGTRNTFLGSVYVSPVCSPALARTIHHYEDIFDHTLIELRSQRLRGWSGLNRRIRAEQVLTLDSYLECMRAAEQGLGVAYAVFPLTTEWVTQQRLAVPVPYLIALNPGLRWVCRADDRRPVLDEIAAWLKDEFAKLPALQLDLDLD